MNPRAINTQKDPIRNRRPSRILRVAIETHLILGFSSELAENGVFIGVVFGSHGCLLQEVYAYFCL
jgi:hypothetical protein